MKNQPSHNRASGTRSACRRASRASIALSIIVLTHLNAALSHAAPSATFVPLGGAAPVVGAGQDTKSFATAVSGDGLTIAGYESSGYEPVRWDGTIGPIPLLPGSRFLFGRASDVSHDGSVIVGSNVADPNAFRWSRTEGITPITSTSSFIEALGVSDDGAVVVGSTFFGDLNRQAYGWTAATGVVGIGYLPGGSFSIAEAASADGSVIVGQSQSDLHIEPFRWTASGGMAPLRMLDGTQASGSAGDVTADGTVVVGYVFLSGPYSDSFRWTESEGRITLGPLPPEGLGSFARGVSDDGSIVVGTYETASGLSAYIWNELHGMRDLQSVLTDQFGVELSGWRLTNAEDVSSTGTVIVGYGIDPEGKYQAWRVTLPIPEPTTFLLAAMNLAAIAAASSRHRKRIPLTAETELEFYRRKQDSVVVRTVEDDRVVAVVEVVSPGDKASQHATEAFT